MMLASIPDKSSDALNISLKLLYCPLILYDGIGKQRDPQAKLRS
jgi:hypothetical protein